jgi:hypothetical protein
MRFHRAVLCLLLASCGCSSSSSPPVVDDAKPADARNDTKEDVAADADTCAPDAAGDACCCSGDVVDFPVCAADGTLSCRGSMSLYHGDDCRCLADRDTPCCLPHVFDGGPHD